MNLSPENRLLLLCARASDYEERVRLITELLSYPVNWDEALESAVSKGIAPLLYCSLKGISDKSLVPGDVMDELKNEYLGNTARNVYLFAELQRILNAFAEKGTSVMLLKGAALTVSVYRDIGLRFMSDFDLLVRQEDLSGAKEIMHGLSYISQTQIESEGWYADNHFHLPLFLNKEKSVIVEVHRHITNEFRSMDIDKWWERSLPADLQGAPALVPSPHDMLFHLCIHLYHHNYNDTITLRGFCDIAEIVSLQLRVITVKTSFPHVVSGNPKSFKKMDSGLRTAGMTDSRNP